MLPSRTFPFALAAVTLPFPCALEVVQRDFLSGLGAG
jgi:hypothetical protein